MGEPVTSESKSSVAKTEEKAALCAAAGKPEPRKGEEADLMPEEEVLEGDWMRPHVDLHEVEVKSGEEDEETFWQHRAKLYRWAKETTEWKERGIGEAKLLKHKQTGKIRFLLRQEKTLKIVANHYVVRRHKFCQLTPNVSSDKIWVWSVVDFADQTPKVEQLGLKFGQVEVAAEFKRKFEEAAEANMVPFKSFLQEAEAASGPAEQEKKVGTAESSTKAV